MQDKKARRARKAKAKSERARRAQIALYVVIAALIIAIIVLGYFVSEHAKKAKISEEEINLAKSYVAECIKAKLLEEGIPLIAKQGGYYKLPNESINFLDESTAFYLKDGKLLVPHKRVVEIQIENWINNNTRQCLNLPYEGMKASSFEARAYLKEKELQVDIKNLKIMKEKTSSLVNFDFSLALDILRLLNASLRLVNEYKNETDEMPGYLCIECIDRIAVEEGINLTIVPVTKTLYREEHVWFLLNSSQKLNDKYLIWRFVTELR
ncbi:MAG: hypothetical protein QXE64_00800 [Candidatus Pacearchaeota archaeon]